jgi:hypothetical protein
MQTLGQIIFNTPVKPLFQPSPSEPQVVGNHHKKLEEMAERSQRVLMRLSSKKPFDLFPDELIVDENKVSLVHREFGMTDVHTVFIENISYVTINTSLVSATLSITDSTSERFPVLLEIQWLKKDEAVRARKLLHGLMAAKKVDINFADFDTAELINDCEKLGEVKGGD